MKKFKTGGLRRHGIVYSFDTGRLMGDPFSSACIGTREALAKNLAAI